MKKFRTETVGLNLFYIFQMKFPMNVNEIKKTKLIFNEKKTFNSDKSNWKKLFLIFMNYSKTASKKSFFFLQTHFRLKSKLKILHWGKSFQFFELNNFFSLEIFF